MTTPPPTRFRFADDGKTVLVADWRDGHVSAYPLAYLRGWCPCAQCQGHAAGQHFVDPPAELRVASIVPIGSYAIQLGWSDGHATGIHPFADLRATCPCASCGGAREGTPAPLAALCLEVNRLA